MDLSSDSDDIDHISNNTESGVSSASTVFTHKVKLNTMCLVCSIHGYDS